MKKFKFDQKKAQEVQAALENLKNETLSSLSGECFNGGEWIKLKTGKVTFSSDCPGPILEGL
ncbi:MAG TPA: hypothetical protein DCS93_13515 [Microscillaceae bacterium]|nr:hypothetical protein [Microscillaceae bacterium]